MRSNSRDGRRLDRKNLNGCGRRGGMLNGIGSTRGRRKLAADNILIDDV